MLQDLPPTFWTYLQYVNFVAFATTGYHVTTKPGQSKYTAGPSRDGSILKTKLLTGERKWTFVCAKHRAHVLFLDGQIDGCFSLRLYAPHCFCWLVKIKTPESQLYYSLSFCIFYWLHCEQSCLATVVHYQEQVKHFNAMKEQIVIIPKEKIKLYLGTLTTHWQTCSSLYSVLCSLIFLRLFKSIIP